MFHTKRKNGSQWANVNIDKREDKGRSVIALNNKLNPHYAKARLQFSQWKKLFWKRNEMFSVQIYVWWDCHCWQRKAPTVSYLFISFWKTQTQNSFFHGHSNDIWKRFERLEHHCQWFGSSITTWFEKGNISQGWAWVSSLLACQGVA